MKIAIPLQSFSRQIAAIGALALGLVATSASALAALNVVATTADLGSIAQAVCGPDASVTVLARPKEDPHFVDARPSFLRILHKADLLIDGGADLEEGWLPPLVNNSRNAKIQLNAPGRFQAAEDSKIALRDVPTVLDRSQGDIHAHGNPHFLLNPPNAALTARALATRLASLDAAHADAFRARAAKFDADIQIRLNGWKKRLAPLRGTKVITYHRSFDYLLEVFALQLAGTIEPKPGIEPSVAHITALAKQAKRDGVRFILAEPARPERLCHSVAQNSGATLVRVPLMPENPAAPDAYVQFIENIVASLEKASNTSPTKP